MEVVPVLEVITKLVESTWSVYSKVMKLDSYMPFTTAAVVIVAVVIAAVVPVDVKPDERLIGAWLLSSFAS